METRNTKYKKTGTKHKWFKQPSASAADIPADNKPDQAPLDPHWDYGDRERTEERYFEAYKLLQNVIQNRIVDTSGLDWTFDELSGEPTKFDDNQFKIKIHKALALRQKNIKDKSLYATCKRIVESIYTALSPLAENLLQIASNAQSVLWHKISGLIIDPGSQSLWNTL
jgi:hypothetical protein